MGPQDDNLHHQMGIIITLQLQQLLLPQLQQQYQLHHITLHCANYTAAHYNYNYNYNYTTLHNITLHYATYVTLRYKLHLQLQRQLQLQCDYH